MATLQRSTYSFRRQGSSGMVWDDRFMRGEFRQMDEEGEVEHRELRHCQSVKPFSSSDPHGCSFAGPSVCTRSLSTGPKKQASSSSKTRFFSIFKDLKP